MSKRTQSIRSLFAAGDGDAPQGSARTPVQRVTSGAVRSLQDTFSDVERDYEALKRRVADGELPVELDPLTVDPSPFSDRFSDHDRTEIDALITSIRENGQEIPILVRPHPTLAGRYQIAYGHRRLRAVTELGLQVKAFVRELDDSRLVVAQGIENSAREDLSFVERAAFANKLEAAGFQRQLIQSALSVDRAEVSKLISVAQAIPDWTLAAIGRAPKIGRGRWQEFAELLQQADAETKIRKAIDEKSFKFRDSDERFMAILHALKKAEGTKRSKATLETVATASSGAKLATLSFSAKHCNIQINKERDEAFARFVMEQIPTLYAEFQQGDGADENR